MENSYNELKIRVAAEKALAENNRKTLEKNLNDFKNIMDNIPDATKTRLLEFGIDVNKIENIDYNRLKTDVEYIKEIQRIMTIIIMKCKEIAERALAND